MRRRTDPYRPSLDRLGFSASTLCAIHCAATPFLLSILPAIGLGFLANSVFELAMIGVSISIGAISLGSSWRHHRKWNALMMMASGGFLLLFNFFGHDTHSPLVETLHPWIAAFAGLMIASAHWINMRLCKTCHTCELDHTHEHLGHEHLGHEHVGHEHTGHEHVGHEHPSHEHTGHEHPSHEHTGHEHPSHEHTGHEHAGHEHSGLEHTELEPHGYGQRRDGDPLNRLTVREVSPR